MDKLLCFKIKNENLYLEQILIEINDDPVFYICKSQTGQYYIVLCTDEDEGNYIIINTKISDILFMLNGLITMRNLYERVSFYWDVRADDEIDNDVVVKHDIKDIDKSLLPYKDRYFIIHNEEIKDYACKIENSLFCDENEMHDDESSGYTVEGACKTLTNASFDFDKDIEKCTEKLVDDKLLNEQWNNVNKKFYNVKYDLSSRKATSLYSYIAA